MSDNSESLQEQILQALQLLARWLEESADKPIYFGEPPLNPMLGAQVRLQRRKPLPDLPGKGYIQAKRWARQALNASGFPTLIFVVRGEAHFRIGVTDKMVKRKPGLARESGIYTLEIKGPACLLLPPQTPLGDASRPHWERDDKPQADSVLLWANVQPEAAVLHLCRTSQGHHEATNSLLVPDTQLFPLLNLLQTELDAQKQLHETIGRNLLHVLVLRAARGIKSQKIIAGGDPALEDPQNGATQTSERSHTAELERACRYIKVNLGYHLSPEKIAAHAFVSPSQLKRLFRNEMDTSVMRYVKQQRMQTAVYYLRNSNMQIQEIARSVGYTHASLFSRDFASFAGVNPRAYRDKENDPKAEPH